MVRSMTGDDCETTNYCVYNDAVAAVQLNLQKRICTRYERRMSYLLLLQS